MDKLYHLSAKTADRRIVGVREVLRFREFVDCPLTTAIDFVRDAKDRFRGTSDLLESRKSSNPNESKLKRLILPAAGTFCV